MQLAHWTTTTEEVEEEEDDADDMWWWWWFACCDFRILETKSPLEQYMDSFLEFIAATLLSLSIFMLLTTPIPVLIEKLRRRLRLAYFDNLMYNIFTRRIAVQQSVCIEGDVHVSSNSKTAFNVVSNGSDAYAPPYERRVCRRV